MNALQVFQAADDAWSMELAKVYKSAAGDARYDKNRNASTPLLRLLRDARDAAMAEWEQQKGAK